MCPFLLSENQDVVTQMYNSSGKRLITVLYSNVFGYSVHSVTDTNVGHLMWSIIGTIPRSSGQKQTDDRRADS